MHIEFIFVGSQQSQPQPNVSQEGSKHKTVQPRVASSQSQQSQQEGKACSIRYWRVRVEASFNIPYYFHQNVRSVSLK